MQNHVLDESCGAQENQLHPFFGLFVRGSIKRMQRKIALRIVRIIAHRPGDVMLQYTHKDRGCFEAWCISVKVCFDAGAEMSDSGM